MLRSQALLLLFMLLPVSLHAQVLPKSPVPSQKMISIDVKKEPSEVKLLVYVLQGLVNRTSPRLYVVDDQYEGGNDEKLQARMKDWGREALEKQGVEVREVAAWPELLSMFRDAYRGGYLYEDNVWSDPNRAHVVNGIITECGLNDLLPLTEEMNKTYKLQIHGGAEGRWPDMNDFIMWAGSNKPALETLNRQVLLHKHPWSFYGVDYAVAHRLMTFWVEKDTYQSERGYRRLARILKQTKPNTGVLGVWQSWWPKATAGTEGIDELALLKFFSDHGKFLVPLVSPGNLTVHSGFRVKELKQKEIPFRPLDPSKVYVTFILSDGDNVSGFNLIRPILWNEQERGTFPIGWTFSPALLDLAPDVLSWFYDTATPADYFVTACSGYGYVRAGYGSATTSGTALLNDYLELTGEYMKRADSREIWNWWMDEETISRYFEQLPFMTGMFIEPEPRADTYDKSFLLVPKEGGQGAKPVFHTFASAGLDLKTDEKLTSAVEHIKAQMGGEKRPRFAFVGLNGFQVGPKRLADVVKLLPEEYVVVRPDEFIHLYKTALRQEKEKQ